MPIDVFRALQRDVAWGFFYGIVNFDAVFGTMNHYGNVDWSPAGSTAYRRAEVDYNENFTHDDLMACFPVDLLTGRTRIRPVRSAVETGQPFGRNKGSNGAAVARRRVVAQADGRAGDEPIRTDDTGHLVNRAFADGLQDEPTIEAEPGMTEDEVLVQPVPLHLAVRRDVEPRRSCRRARNRCTARRRRSSSCR